MNRFKVLPDGLPRAGHITKKSDRLRFTAVKNKNCFKSKTKRKKI